MPACGSKISHPTLPPNWATRDAKLSLPCTGLAAEVPMHRPYELPEGHARDSAPGTNSEIDEPEDACLVRGCQIS